MQYLAGEEESRLPDRPVRDKRTHRDQTSRDVRHRVDCHMTSAVLQRWRNVTSYQLLNQVLVSDSSVMDSTGNSDLYARERHNG